MTHLEQVTQTVQKDAIYLELCDHRSTAPHRHSFFELVYVLSGRTLHFFGGSTKIIRAGDFFLIDLEKQHSYTAIRTDEPFAIINCMFLPRFLDHTLSDVRSFDGILRNYLIQFAYDSFITPPTRNIYHDSDGTVRFLMKQMLNEYKTKGREYRELIRSYLTAAIINLLRRESVSDSSNARDLTLTIKEYVLQNYQKQISLSEICRDVNFSLSNVSILFEKNAGMSFRNYLQKIRMEKACELLTRTDKNIADIADLVGYSDPAFFYRVFKKLLNMTPQEYRNNTRSIRTEP